jgi:hypothetical protein
MGGRCVPSAVVIRGGAWWGDWIMRALDPILINPLMRSEFDELLGADGKLGAGT